MLLGDICYFGVTRLVYAGTEKIFDNGVWMIN
jgi:hypothetical protein